MLSNDIRNYRAMDSLYIAHHGILGQKWGVRRFQDKNGRLTTEGKQRRSVTKEELLKKDDSFEKMSPSEREEFKNQIKTLLKKEKDDKERDVLDAWLLDLDDRENVVNERERWDRFNRWVAKKEELYNTNPEYKKTEDRIKDLRHQIDTIELEIVSTNVTKERREALEKKAEPLVSEVRELEDKSIKIEQKEMPEFYHSDLACEIYSAISDEDYISHYGILGQKWGKKNGPPYPLAAGSHSSSEKKAASAAGVKVGKSSGKGSSEGLNVTQSGQKENPGLVGSVIQGVKNAKLNKQRKQALEKAREAKAKKAEEKAAAEAHEAAKQKALNSGDYNEIQKYAKEASYTELQTALNKADALKRLNKAIVDNTPVEPSLQDKIDDAASKIRTATNLATNGIEAWNKVATVWNTFADENSMLPEIGKNWAEEQEKKRKEKNEKVRKEAVEAIQKRNNAEEILKNQSLFTNSELADASKRLTNASTIKSYTDGGKNKDSWKSTTEAKKDEKKEEKSSKKDKKEASTMKDQVSQVNAMLLKYANNDTPINLVVNLPDFSKQEEEVKKIWLPR